jgi:hypothetical protein
VLRWQIFVTSTVLTLGACAQRPAATYDPPPRSAELAAALSTSDVNPPASGYRLLASPSEGRFACDLAIAPLVRGPSGSGWTLAWPTSAEQAYWSEQFRGARQVRGAVFVPPKTLRPADLSLTSLCDAAERLGAPLLLVYAAGRTGPTSAETIGVLYDATSGTPLAALRATTNGRVDPAAPGGSIDEEEGDHRNRDARFQAQRQFEQIALACLGELMRQDRPAPTTQPHRWQQPFVERWWMSDQRYRK